MNAPEKPVSHRGPIAWMAGHSVAANLIMLVCLVGGILSLLNIRQEIFPNIALDIVEVKVSYPGASPEEVEKGIILAVEEAIRGLDGIEEVTSVANEGSGTVRAEVMLGADPDEALNEVKQEVDRIRTFPEDAEEPKVKVSSHKRAVLSIVIYGEQEDAILHQLAEKIRERLLHDPAVTQAEVEGLPPLEIGIEVPQENLRRYGLTLDEVADRIRNASVDLPGGGVKTRGGEILLRVKERRDYGREFSRIPIISTPGGGRILLGQIATIRDDFEDADRYARYNGKPAVLIEVYRVGDQTPISVADAVQRCIRDVQPELPPGVAICTHRDRSQYYRQRVGLLLRNGALGLGIVFVVLGLFLEARLAFWVMMGIPISFLGSFLILPATGVTINMVSLFAYIVALGIVVDDAIVVGENVYHYRQEGMSALDAAIRGAREVAMPVTFSILTNMVTFLPIYFLPGVMGKIFYMIPIVVCVVFAISLGESLFVLPSHLAHLKKRTRWSGFTGWLHARQQAFSHAVRNWVRYRYGPFLRRALGHRYLVITVGFTILLVMLSYALSGRMGFGLFPRAESDRSEASLVMPYGTPVERTEAVMRRMLAGVRKVVEKAGRPELVQGIIADVGRSGSHTGHMSVELAPPDVRNKIMSVAEFTDRWRDAVGEVPGVEYLVFKDDAGGPGSHGRAASVELSHSDIDVLERASKELAARLEEYPRVKDVDDGYQLGKNQLDFAIKPEGKSLGLTARAIALQVRHAFYGAEAARQQRGRNEIKVMVRLPEKVRRTEEAVEDLMIRTPAGAYVPLHEVAVVRRGRAYTKIDRRNGRRAVQVAADVSPRSKAGEVLADLKVTVLPGLLAKYPRLTYSFEGHRADMRESMGSLRFTFILAMLAIYVMLAIPFRSYLQPLIVMVSIPFGIVGAFLGHLIMGYDLCIPSMFGIVALAGVVVNDSLVLIDFANRRLREDGLTPVEAIHSAAIQRFRPIMLTTLTTFGGLAPMIFETSRQARFLIPMALSLGYGIVFATLITLLLVPSLFMAIEDARRGLAALRGVPARRREETHPEGAATTPPSG